MLLAVLDGGGELLLEDARLAPQLHVALALGPQRLLVARLQLQDLLVSVLLGLPQHLLHRSGTNERTYFVSTAAEYLGRENCHKTLCPR